MGPRNKDSEPVRDGILYTSRPEKDQLLIDRVKAMSIESSVPRTIGTKGLFPLMELPAELRLEVCYTL